ncbi:MAG: ABC transporter ATP-binding protein [Magnetospirillum sp.]|nr:ABC transporter ATP-binding protein [Magnetospirillum sp.]
MLTVESLRAGYGTIEVLHGVSFEVNAGECVALIGANGSGKTSTLKAICGLLPVRAGQVTFEGARIDGMPGHTIVKRGIAMCPEGRQVFPEMTVVENLRIGAYARKDSKQESDIAAMQDLFPILRERAQQDAGKLSGGEQEMLAIARALMARPKLCIFDEPSLGLAPKIVAEVEATIARIKAQGMTTLLVEQNSAMALRLADRVYLYESGEIVLTGTSAQLRDDPAIAKAYLGE